MKSRTFVFEKDSDSRWYVDLPEWAGTRAELEMVCGANNFLDMMAEGDDMVTLFVSEEPFHNSNELTLMKKDEENGGGWYILKTFKGIDLNMEMWLCDVVKFVFGDVPEKIYIA
jgi:hypothetical protein